jgi:hypothetical protein
MDCEDFITRTSTADPGLTETTELPPRPAPAARPPEPAPGVYPAQRSAEYQTTDQGLRIRSEDYGVTIDLVIRRLE